MYSVAYKGFCLVKFEKFYGKTVKKNEKFIYYFNLINCNRTKTPGSDASMYPVVKL